MENGNITSNENVMGHEKPVGPAIATIIIVLILIIGAFYFWGSKLEKVSPADENMTAESILAQPDASLDALKTQGTSDEISSIEQDINATDLQNLNAETKNIDVELAI